MKTGLILPKSVVSFMSVFRDKKYEIYLVGGGVRDLLLGKTTTNWDFTTNATPEIIQKLFPTAFYNNNFGTVTIPVEDQDVTLLFEVTPYRSESSYDDHRHPTNIAWAETIEEDLSRRDFTINALALSEVEGIANQIVDPYDGHEDLTNKIVKAVGDPDKRFSEDSLRLLRAVRFATQLEFAIEEKTLVSLKKSAALIQKISAERIRDELFKILGSDRPAEGILLLKDTGLLQFILPEVMSAFSIDQKSPERHHIDDVGTHLIKSLAACPSTDVITRFATLLHDIGKVETCKKDEETGIITFYNHEIVGAQQTEKIADRLRLSKKQKDKLVKLVRFHMFTVSEDQTDSAIRRFIRNVTKEYMFDALDLRVADRLGSGAKLTSWRTELFKKRLDEVQHEPFSVKDLKINGHDVMKELNLKPSPKIGEILEKLFAEIESGKLKNDREALLSELTK